MTVQAQTESPAGYAASSVDPSTPEAVPLLQVVDITKRYPGTLALDNVSFDVRPGEVHVLFGENGAGKSTLIQTIAGVHRPTAGKIILNGREVVLESVRHARQLGISAVFQEFSVVPHMTVEENIFLGDEITTTGLLDKRALHRLAQETLDRLGFHLRPDQHAMYLSRAEQQMIEIAKAFRTRPSIIILDEPTASLTERETERLFELVDALKAEGIGIIYITHRMSEILRIGDRITVLRDGRFIRTLPVAGTTQERLVELMTGRVVDQIFPDIRHAPGEELLRLEGVTAREGAETLFEQVSLRLHAGEVVGIAGLVGSGKSEIGRACFGIGSITAGRMILRGQTVRDEATGRISPRVMLDRGLCYVPSDRRSEGLAMMLTVRENMALSALELPRFSSRNLLNRSSERREIAEIARKLDLSPMNIERSVEHFSGGNQQKVLIGKALVRIDETRSGQGNDMRIFIFDEPTVGVDVGARMLIYRAIRDLCEQGAGVILISSDLPEILNLAHRTYVMHRARLQAELTAAETTEQNVLSYFFDPETE